MDNKQLQPQLGWLFKESKMKKKKNKILIVIKTQNYKKEQTLGGDALDCWYDSG